MSPVALGWPLNPGEILPRGLDVFEAVAALPTGPLRETLKTQPRLQAVTGTGWGETGCLRCWSRAWSPLDRSEFQLNRSLSDRLPSMVTTVHDNDIWYVSKLLKE